MNTNRLLHLLKELAAKENELNDIVDEILITVEIKKEENDDST